MAKFVKIRDEEALAYHEFPRPGKLGVYPTKPCLSQRDLSLAYTPGVAVPCLEIEKDPDLAYHYTNKGNLVAVISNGTAVLGLGDIGALSGKPVMEGKAVLFNRFAGIDVFDIEVDSHDVEEVIRTVQLIAPTFGGINLEDIKAPECFEVEQRLIEAARHPGLPRRPARDRDHLGAAGSSTRWRSVGKGRDDGHSGDPRRRRRGDRLRRHAGRLGRPQAEHPACSTAPA